MAEVLVRFSDPVRGEDGTLYDAQACGRPAENDLWEGWIEFIPRSSGIPARTARETTQPNRTDLAYWATGLSLVYLEGALRRATSPEVRREPAPEATPYFAGPATGPLRTVVAEPPRAVLDPFATYAQGENILRQELAALDEDHLRNVLRHYGGRSANEVDDMSPAELRHAILALARGGAVPGAGVDDRAPRA